MNGYMKEALLTGDSLMVARMKAMKEINDDFEDARLIQIALKDENKGTVAYKLAEQYIKELATETDAE